MNYSPKSYRTGAATIAVLSFCLAASTAQASAISYSMVMCEDLGVLVHPDNLILAENAAVKPQVTLMLERTMPFIQLNNTSEDEDSLLTQFTMSIGDTSKNFDWAKLVTASPGVNFSLQQPDRVAGSVKSDEVIINLTNFKPGDFVRFRVGLSPDNPLGNPIMDYRNVLYHMNSVDASRNSMITVNFANSVEPLRQQLPNFPNDNPFTSTDLRALTTRCGMDSIEAVSTGTGGSIPSIPEPGGLVLMGIAVLGLTLFGARRRRPAE